MTLKNDTPIEVTAERPWKMTPESGVVTLLPDLDGSAVVERLTFSMIDSSGGTRVMLDCYVVRTSRLGKEYVKPANNAPGLEKLQAMLDSVGHHHHRSTDRQFPLPATANFGAAHQVSYRKLGSPIIRVKRVKQPVPAQFATRAGSV